MDLTFSAEERAFERQVRDFIAANLTAEMKRATALTPSVFSDPDIGMAWQRALHKQGWGAPGWPLEYGGPNWTPAQRWIFEAESARAGVPNVNVMGVKRSARSSSASARKRRRISTCRESFPARITGARAIPSRARAPISPR
jgi:alkylation response protein AidB-like acyl-CoA dehydrogenase